MDCIQGMNRFPDRFFDLAIVDPPYGIDAANMAMGKGSKKWVRKDWDRQAPDESYFTELFRVSKNQIIFGYNYFTLPPCKGFIVWDKKCVIVPARDQADCELIWSSFKKVARIARILWDGFLGSDGEKIHPTQKPLALYHWLLKKYANPGDRILDTHLGSGSSRIAAYKMGYDFWGYEIDKDYFDTQEKRFAEQTFEPLLVEIQKTEQLKLI